MGTTPGGVRNARGPGPIGRFDPHFESQGHHAGRARQVPGLAARAREHLEGICGHLKLDAQGDPATLARRCFALLGSQHDTGTFRIEVECPGRALLEVRDYALPSAEMCGILTGHLAESLRLAGASNLRIVALSCRTEGVDVCSWSAEWDA